MITRLDTDADLALFRGDLSGILATCYENERPLLGLAGLLDWRFHGAVSFHLRRGSFTGKPGELIYIPTLRNGKTFHLFLLGCGSTSEPGVRTEPELRILEKSLNQISESRIEPIGLSIKDFGQASEEAFQKKLQKLSSPSGFCLVN